MNRVVAKKMDEFKYVIGVDEVGRGPIAGPVAVGAFVFLNDAPAVRRKFRGVKESKQLSESAREKWFKVIEECRTAGHVDFCVSFEGQDVIDDKGLACAIRKSLAASLRGLKIKKERGRGFDHITILLDGGLKAPSQYPNQKTIIRGDEKEMVIALASICAKVLRDRKMVELAKLFPLYGFEKHKGYGTREHYKAIARHGALDIHRKSFLM